MEARNRVLKDWLTKIRSRQIVLPRFQRFEAWSPNFVADVLTNVIRGLPIGSTLVFGVGDRSPFVSRPIVGAPTEGEKINELLLDGQQRLTALWRSLNDNYPDKTYLVYLPGVDEEESEPYVYAESRWTKNHKKFPLWVDRPDQCWEGRVIPIRLLNPDNESEYKDWAKTASAGNKDTEITIRDRVSSFRSSVANFQLPFLYLEPTTPKAVAIDVFVKLNTRFVKLTAFDIVVAQVEEATGRSLHDLVDSLKASARGISSYMEPADLVLATSALLQDRQPTQKGYLDLDFIRVVAEWAKIVKGAQRLVEFLEQEKIFDWERLPSETPLPALIALWADSPQKPDDAGNVRILLRKYLWRAFFTGRYDKAAATALLQDYRGLKSLVLREPEKKEIPCFDESKYPLTTREALMQASWPKFRDRLARAILLLSFRGDAEDIADGASVARENIAQREYHHLYPRSWLKRRESGEEDADRALNCILVTWRTNREIAAKSPIEYLKERCKASALGQKEIRRRLRTHYVGFDSLARGRYRDFLIERAEACEKAIRLLCDGESWRP